MATTKTDYELTHRLVGMGLDIARVTVTPTGSIVAQWNRKPSDTDRAKAEGIEPNIQHAV